MNARAFIQSSTLTGRFINQNPDKNICHYHYYLYIYIHTPAIFFCCQGLAINYQKSWYWLVVEPYPSENDGVKVSWDDDIPNFSWKVIQNSMVPVTTNQMLWLTPMVHFRTPPCCHNGYVIICHHPKDSEKNVVVSSYWLCHHIGYVILCHHHMGYVIIPITVPTVAHVYIANWKIIIFKKGTLWWTNIAMENGPFIVDFPIKNGDFPLLCERSPEGKSTFSMVHVQ